MDLIQELEDRRAILRGRHFVLKRGDHTADYINLDYIFPDSEFMSQLGLLMAKQLSSLKLDGLIAPAVGGIATLHWVGWHLAEITGRWPQLFWADKVAGGFDFERADWQERLKGLRIAGVEDVPSTGSSLKKVIDLARRAGAEVVAAEAIFNRGNVTAEALGVEQFSALAEANFTAYPEANCPLCKSHKPIVEDIAHGDEFKLQNPNYAGGYIKLLS